MATKGEHGKVGKPTVMTKDVLAKLDDAFMFCYTDEEACLYADIHPATLYRYQEAHPEYSERKKALRLTPNLQAKKELVGGIKGNIAQARWWAQTKISDEFGEKTTIKHEGKVETDTAITKGVSEAIRIFNENMRATLTKKKK